MDWDCLYIHFPSISPLKKAWKVQATRGNRILIETLLVMEIIPKQIQKWSNFLYLIKTMLPLCYKIILVHAWFTSSRDYIGVRKRFNSIWL